jgi:predicted ester cyclase
MSRDDALARIREWYERGWGSGDIEVIRRHAEAGVVDVWHATEGIDALVATVSDLRRTFPDLEITVTDQVGGGDRVTTIWSARGTDTGGLFAMPPTGRTLDIQAICLDDLAGSRVVRHQQVSDMWRLARQLGVIPAEWQGDRPLVLAR